MAESRFDDLEDHYYRLKRARETGEPAYQPEEPFVEQPPRSEEETIGSGQARRGGAYAPADLTWEEALDIQMGKAPKPEHVTPGGYLKEKLMYFPGLYKRYETATRAGGTQHGQQTYIDEAGNLVLAGGERVPTVEEAIGVSNEIAGFGVGLAQGPGLVKTLYQRFRDRYKRAPTKAEINTMVKGFEEWSASQPKPAATTPTTEGLRAWRAAERNIETQNAIEKLRLAKEATEQARKAPGIASRFPRMLELPPATSEAIAREARAPTVPEPMSRRVIEAPAAPEQGLLPVAEPEVPRIMMQPAMRDLETGRVVIGPRERPPSGPPTIREVTGVRTGETPLPRDFRAGPSRSERIGSAGWRKEMPDSIDDPTFTLRDVDGDVKAHVIEVEVPEGSVPGKAPSTIWEAREADGKSLGFFETPEEATKAASDKFYPPIAGGSYSDDFPPIAGGSVGERKLVPDPEPPRTGPGVYPEPTPDALEPYSIIKGVQDKYLKGYTAAAEYMGPKIAQAKIAIRMFSPTDIARVYPAFGDLVWTTKKAGRTITERADNLVAQRKNIVKAIGPDEFTRLMKLKDEGKILDTTPEVGQLIDEIYGTMFDYSGDLKTTGILEGGYQRRLKDSQELRGVKAIDVNEYTTKDIDRIAPPSETKLKDKLTGDEAYTVENIDRAIRALARRSVMGTKMKPGYMAEIRPFLERLADKPEVIKDEIDAYVNYFIGAPGARSPYVMQQWADRLRRLQFASKIGGNLTSPIWNLGQQFLTATETDAKSFGKAWANVVKHGKNKLTGQEPDQHFVNLLDRLGLTHEMESADIMSDVGRLPSSALAKIDKGMAKFNDIAGWGFRAVESKLNRPIAALAGYYDGVARGMSDKDAIEYGKKIMDKTQFTGGQADLPRLFRSAGGGAVGQFKGFTIKYAEYMKNNAADFVRAGVDPRLNWQERKDAVRKFAKFWGSQVAVGGVGTIPFVGDDLKEQLEGSPLDIHKGLGGMLGLDLTRQYGIGVLPVKKLTDLWYQLPGPTFNAVQDTIAVLTGSHAGDGLDIEKVGKPLTWDEWERKLVRLLPGGVEGARILETVKTYMAGGEKRKALTPKQAFGLEAPSGHKLSEIERDNVMQMILDAHIRGSDVERESEIRMDEAEKTTIENQAKRDAAELYAAGKREEAGRVLRDAEKKLGRKPNTLRPSLQGLRNARRAQRETPLERLRKQKAKKGEVVPRP
jgi:hypothetical protein